MGEFNCPDLDPEGDTDDFIPVYRGTPHPVTPRRPDAGPVIRTVCPPDEPVSESPVDPGPFRSAPLIPWASLAAMVGLAGLVRWLAGRDEGGR